MKKLIPLGLMVSYERFDATLLKFYAINARDCLKFITGLTESFMPQGSVPCRWCWFCSLQVVLALFPAGSAASVPCRWCCLCSLLLICSLATILSQSHTQSSAALIVVYSCQVAGAFEVTHLSVLFTGACHPGTCFNGGQCMGNMGGFSQQCSCPPGFQGPRCQYGKSVITSVSQLFTGSCKAGVNEVMRGRC